MVYRRYSMVDLILAHLLDNILDKNIRQDDFKGKKN